MRILFVALLLVGAVAAQPQILYVSDAGLSTDQPEGNSTSTWAVPGQPLSWSHEGKEMAGPVFVGLFPGAGIAAGNLSVELWGNGSLMASKELDVSVQAPADPLLLLPPDPSDPEAAALHVQAQLNALMYDPPVLIDLGVVEGNGSMLELRFVMMSGAYEIQYDGADAPTFLYAPFKSPPADPSNSGGSGSETGSSSQTGASQTGSNTAGGSSSGLQFDDETETGQSEDSPGAALWVGLLVAFVVLRRSRSL